jgi:hypothetical protein
MDTNQLINKDEKIFCLPETNDIIVVNTKNVEWWKTFNFKLFAKYVKQKFIYNLKKINLN